MKIELVDKDVIRSKSLFIWVTALITFFLDWSTKVAALNYLKLPEEPVEYAGSQVFEIIPGLLNLRYAFNTGGAFSLMSDHFVLLTIFATVALGLLLFWIYTTPMKSRWKWLSFGMIVGGAIGNLGDRLFRGGVVDFIDAHWYGRHWPTFNIADSGICVGMGIIVFLTLFYPEKSILNKPENQEAQVENG